MHYAMLYQRHQQKQLQQLYYRSIFFHQFAKHCLYFCLWHRIWYLFCLCITIHIFTIHFLSTCRIIVLYINESKLLVCLEISNISCSGFHLKLKSVYFIASLLFQYNHFPVLVAYQAERELQPWIARDDDVGQRMWRINQRIVKLVVELMRNHENAESMVIVASASDLLLRATDGMLVDGEACTLPQLEVVS